MKKSENVQRKVIRNDKINKEIMKKPLSEYKNIFTNRLGSYAKKYVEENNIKYVDIYNETGIIKSSFTNYMTIRLPRYTETLIFLKDYFDVPFSYLFGETETTDVNNIDIGLSCGLNDKAAEALRNAKNDKYILYLINKILSNQDFLHELKEFFIQAILLSNPSNDDLKYIKKNLYNQDLLLLSRILYDFFDSIDYEKIISEIGTDEIDKRAEIRKKMYDLYNK